MPEIWGKNKKDMTLPSLEDRIVPDKIIFLNNGLLVCIES
jgi:hypothetical protein